MNELDKIDINGICNRYVKECIDLKIVPNVPGLCNVLECTKEEFKRWGSQNIRDYKMIMQYLEEEIHNASSNGNIKPEQYKTLLQQHFGYGKIEEDIVEADNLSQEEKDLIEKVLKSNLLKND